MAKVSHSSALALARRKDALNALNNDLYDIEYFLQDTFNVMAVTDAEKDIMKQLGYRMHHIRETLKNIKNNDGFYEPPPPKVRKPYTRKS